LFDEEGKVSFNFLGKVRVTYVNPKRLDTFKFDISKQRVKLMTTAGEKVEIENHLIEEPYAKFVRDGKIESVEIIFLYE
jgi:hypothetical protein